MGTHVNMMDDVLISNLPISYLRSALRTLVSRGPENQQAFVQHIRSRLSEPKPGYTDPLELFPSKDAVSPEFRQYVALVRCLFSSKLAVDALPYLSHFLESVPKAKASWTEGSELSRSIEVFGGDIVQAVQALKETRPERTPELERELLRLQRSLDDVHVYCSTDKLHIDINRPLLQVKDVLAFLFPGEKLTITTAPPSAIYAAEAEGARLQRVTLPTSTSIETFEVGPFEMPRLFNGLWQLSSAAWGSGTAQSQEKALVELVEAGFVATDMADHYGDAELVYGSFRNRLPREVQEKVFAATKWCVFRPPAEEVTEAWVLECAMERCRRLGGRVELLQFHWYDYSNKAYLDILKYLVNFTKRSPELITAIGLCNFDAAHTEEACLHLQKTIGEVGIVSNQVQFSVLDSRPLQKMTAVCEKYGLKLLTYGTFCGGFLSSRWLNAPRPEVYSDSSPLTPSQRKYLDMIDTWGSWTDFQSLLGKLSLVAEKHGVSIANVATRWVLQQKAVGAVIVGTRLGVSAHGEDNARVFGWELEGDDLAVVDLAAVGEGGERTRRVFEMLGDCGEEYWAKKPKS